MHSKLISKSGRGLYFQREARASKHVYIIRYFVSICLNESGCDLLEFNWMTILVRFSVLKRGTFQYQQEIFMDYVQLVTVNRTDT